jgi:hypothetical protein
MVGAAPSINVVSVRATRDGAGFGFADILAAVDLCTSYRTTYNIKAISLSLGVQNLGALDPANDSLMRDSVDNARGKGLNVVAAAGNHSGPADWPAAYSPVFAVAASDNAGARCSFSASGAAVDLSAPGCPQDVALPDGRAAWASGTSESTALVAAVVTQLRGLRPLLTADQAEALLRSTTRAQAAGPTLDVAAAFHAAGLDAELAQGHGSIPNLSAAPTPGSGSGNDATAQPSPNGPAGPATSVVPPPPPTVLPGVVPHPVPRARLSKPLVRSVQFRRGLVTLTFRNRPKGIEARVAVYARNKGRAFPTLVRTLRLRGDRLRTRVSGTLSEVSITYRDPQGVRGPSAPLSLHPRK